MLTDNKQPLVIEPFRYTTNRENSERPCAHLELIGGIIFHFLSYCSSYILFWVILIFTILFSFLFVCESMHTYTRTFGVPMCKHMFLHACEHM